MREARSLYAGTGHGLDLGRLGLRLGFVYD